MPAVFARPADLLGSVGRDLGAGEWLEVTQERLDQFEAATGAASAEYLTLSLVNWFLPQLLDVQGASMGVNYGTGAVRFPAPVTAGTKIRGRGEITAAEEIKGGVQVTVRVTVDADGTDEPACVIDTISRFLE